MPNDVTAERLAKLPGWAQDHVRALESRISLLSAHVETLQAAMNAGPEDSTVFAEAGDGDTERPLGRDIDVRFQKKGSPAYTVGLQEDGGLFVDTTADVLLEPVTTYSVVIRTKES
jgi:hypothetical protein